MSETDESLPGATFGEDFFLEQESSGSVAPPPSPETIGPLDGEEHRFALESVTVARISHAIRSVIFAVIVLVILVTVAFRDLPSWATGGAVALALALIALRVWYGQYWPGLEYFHARFRVDERGIEYRHGVLFRTVVSVPRSRIQHTDVSRGPIQRRFGIATLVIYTAGTLHSTISLPGLHETDALRIRDHLLDGGDDDAV